MSRVFMISDWVERARHAHYRAVELAVLCHVSGSQLRRYFAMRVGQSPQHWLSELRLWEAARMLCYTDFAAKYIARDLGFADESHFCHRFKEYFGCTTTDFMRHNAHGLFEVRPAAVLLGDFVLRAKESGLAISPPWPWGASRVNDQV